MENCVATPRAQSNVLALVAKVLFMNLEFFLPQTERSKTLCILCERYGEGDIWYKNPKNYARRLYGLPKKGPSTAVGRLEEVQELELIKSVIDAKDVSMESFNQQLQGLREMFM
jgi:hypothetical protein